MIIETERLILRPFTDGDENDMYEYLKEPSVHCFYCMKLNSAEEAVKVINERKEDEYCFAIELKENGKVIGEIWGSPEASDPEQGDEDTVSPCWMLNENYQRHGYMYEACVPYYEWLFTKKNVRRIYIYTEDYNVACQHLCMKLGMRKEGEFKEFVSFIKDENGTPIYENTMQFAILKKEWEGR